MRESYMYSTLHRLDPPYHKLDRPIAQGMHAVVPRGTVLVLRIDPRDGWDTIGTWIELLGRTVANAPLALCTDALDTCRAAEYGVRAGLAGVRAVLTDASPPVDALRRQLTDLTTWPTAVALWFRAHGTGPSIAVSDLLGQLAAHVVEHRALSDLAAAHGPPVWTWRRRFAAARLGSAPVWFHALRMTTVAMALQREPLCRLYQIATNAGFSSAAALSDRCWDCIGARPTYIREHLGWQWVLADALRRGGVSIM